MAVSLFEHELIQADSRLEGGATEDDSSSGSLDLLRRLRLPRRRFAAELLGRRGELNGGQHES